MEWAGYRCTDPSPNPQCNLEPPHLTAKAFFSAESKGTEKKANIWNCLLFPVSMRSWGILFLKALVLVGIFKTTKRSHLLWKAQDAWPQRSSWLLHTAEGRCASWLIPYSSGLPQSTNYNPNSPLWALEPRQPWRIFGMRFSQVRPGCHPGLPFLPPAHKIPSALLPRGLWNPAPFSIPSPRLPLHTPHCSSLPVVSVHPLILLLPFLTSPPQGSS